MLRPIANPTHKRHQTAHWPHPTAFPCVANHPNGRSLPSVILNSPQFNTLLGRREYGFFLEFDRGTVRPAPLRAKFAAYHRYLASARAARDYDGPPCILVVTAGPGAEDRVSDAVLAADVGQQRRLPLLVTTIGHLAAADEGPFDAVWRVPGIRGDRQRWPIGRRST